MGRGRQKAKQQKIARKLKYLTTDTDYDELAKELGAQEPGSGSFDPFADIEAKYSHDVDAEDETVGDGQTSSDSADDLDEYAKWAAEAAAKATSGEFPAAKAAPKAPMRNTMMHTRSSPMFSALATSRKYRGRLLSPRARIRRAQPKAMLLSLAIPRMKPFLPARLYREELMKKKRK